MHFFSIDAPSPLPEYVTCWPISGTVTLVTAFLGVLMANETGLFASRCTQRLWISQIRPCRILVILLAMVYIGVKKHRRMRTPLITTFYRDGFVFFLALAGACNSAVSKSQSNLAYAGSSIVNIVLHLSLPVRAPFLTSTGCPC
jgi:hypothetical protein